MDAGAAWLIGFDPERIPIVRQAFRCRHYPLVDLALPDVRVISNNPGWNKRLTEIEAETCYHFKPALGWVNQVERHSADRANKGQL
jgi:hypothetical protein